MLDIFSEIKQYGVSSLATQYGYTLDKTGFGPCPACKATHRHTKSHDPRLACLVVQAGQGWVCLQCGAKGDSVDFLARTLNQGIRPTNPEGWRAVLSRWQAGGATRPLPTPRKPQDGAARGLPDRPPFKAMMEFWNLCSQVPDDRSAEWLKAKYPSYLISELIETGCARWIPKKQERPVWFPWQYPTMVMLAFDQHGLVQSMHGRICADLKPGIPKSRFPLGYSASGLVLGNKSAVSWLRGKMPVPAVVIAEGLTSTLACTMALRKGNRWRWAVLGYTSGSHSAIREMPWSKEDVYIFTDSDKTGEEYSERIASSLPPGINVRRCKL